MLEHFNNNKKKLSKIKLIVKFRIKKISYKFEDNLSLELLLCVCLCIHLECATVCVCVTTEVEMSNEIKGV